MNASYALLEVEQLEQPAESKRWIWEGYLAPGLITLFTSVWKSGKTTLVSHLLSKRKTGGVLAGCAVAPGVSAVITEEPAALWRERHARLGFGAHDCFCCRPFRGVPSKSEWLAFIDFLKNQQATRGMDLVIFDPLSHFLPPGAENHPRLVLDALAPLHTLTQVGVAVLLVHHPRKGNSSPGALSRGTGGLDAFADFVIEMYRVDPDNIQDRRRRLIGLSRDPATPVSVALELNADGADYALVDAPIDNDAFFENWIPLRILLDNADGELTRQEIRKVWPASFPTPAKNTLWRWLNQAHQRGLIQRSGVGTRVEPFRYFLTDKRALWQAKPAASDDMAQLDAWLDDWAKKYPAPPEWDRDEPEADGDDDR